MNLKPAFASARVSLPALLITLTSTLALLGSAPSARADNLVDGVSIVPAGSPVLTTNIPDPASSSVTPCDELGGVVLSPNVPSPLTATQIQIVVRNVAMAPIIDAAIEVRFHTPELVCPNAVLTGMTDSSGRLSLTLAGGGCQTDEFFGCVVRANGVTIRNFSNVKSPDFDGAGGDHKVDIADLVAFSAEFLGTSAPDCHDYDNTGTTDLGDLIMFAPAFTDASHCP
ncbi:MAG: hypothetical protein R3E97_05565 [Candidatus Eisenbacteria bacterium]